MAAAEHPLPFALAGLYSCLGRPPALPRTRDECAELLQALVTWATPGPEAGSEKKVPTRAAAALLASLLLLEAVRAETHGGGHVTSASSAKAERELKSENAEESEKSSASSLLVEDVTGGNVAHEEGGAGPKSTEGRGALNLQQIGEEENFSNVAPSAEMTDVALASTEKTGVALESPNNSDGVPTAAEKSNVAPASTEKSGVALESPGDIDDEDEVMVGSDVEPVSGIIDPQYILPCATAPLLLLCGAHIQDTPWTDAQSRRLANQLLRSLLEASQCTSVGELLKGHQEQPYKTFREALGLLGPRLRKDTWESHPDARLVFAWLLFRVPRPWLSDFLSRVMPPSLLFSDDYKPENKVLGIRCLHHIIKNVPAAELRQYNRALVVYHALRNHLHTTDAEVIEAVLPCLLDLFPVLHKPPPALGAYQKDGENPSDQVMQLVLTHMEMEHKMGLRRLYAQSLPALQERLGVRIVRHMKRLLCVIVEYLEVHDGPEETARLSVLETLQGTIKYAWPRIPPRLRLLLKALVKLIYELSSESNPNSVPVTEALLNRATECLLLLDKCCKGQVKAALQDLPSVCAEPLLLEHITRVLHNT